MAWDAVDFPLIVLHSPTGDWHDDWVEMVGPPPLYTVISGELLRMPEPRFLERDEGGVTFLFGQGGTIHHRYDFVEHDRDRWLVRRNDEWRSRRRER